MPCRLNYQYCIIMRRHDTQHNDTQLNDTQHNDTQHNNLQHDNNQNATLSITTLTTMTVCCYNGRVLLCWVAFMLSVTSNPFMLNVIMLSVVMVSVVAPCHDTMMIQVSYCQWFSRYWLYQIVPIDTKFVRYCLVLSGTVKHLSLSSFVTKMNKNRFKSWKLG